MTRLSLVLVVSFLPALACMDGAPPLGSAVCAVTSEAELAALAAEPTLSCVIDMRETTIDDLDALSGLSAIDGLRALDNERLVDIAALSSITWTTARVEGSPLQSEVELRYSGATTFERVGVEDLRLTGYGPLQSTVRLRDNPRLASLEITGEAFALTLEDSPLIASLAAVELAPGATLAIRRNAALPEAEILALAVRVEAGIVDHCGNLDDAPCPATIPIDPD